MNHDVASDERLLRGHSGRIAVSLAVGWGGILLGRQVLAPLLPAIIADLGLSPASAGFALTLIMGLYSLLQYPAGRLSDELSRATVIVGGLLLSLVGFAALGLARNYPEFLLGAAVVGIGTGFYFTPSRALLSDLFVERRGEAMGMQTTAAMLGGALAGGTAVVALSVASWQVAFLPAMVALATVALLVHRWRREPYVLGRASLDLRSTGLRLVSTPAVRDIVAMRILTAFVFQAIVGFLPTFLQSSKSFSPSLAGGVFALVFVAGAAAGPVAGHLSDRHPRSWVLLGSIIAGTVGLIGLVLAGSTLLLIGSTVLVAAGLVPLFPVMQAYLMDHFPDGSMGGDLGAVKTVYTGLGSLGPTYVGVVAERWDYAAAFAGLVVLLVLAVGVVFRLVGHE